MLLLQSGLCWASTAESLAIVDGQITEYGLEVMAAQTDLAFIGTLEAVEYQCLNHEGTTRPRSSTALLDLSVTESIYGHPESERIRVRAYKVPDPGCMEPAESTHPERFEIGSSYALLCIRDFQNDGTGFSAEWSCRNQGLYAVDPDGEIRICNGDLTFGVEAPMATLRKNFDRLDPQSMYETADLVILATRFEFPEEEYRRPCMIAGPSNQQFVCTVEQVLKGELPSEQMTVGVHRSTSPILSQYVTPVIDQTDRALLFLVKDGARFDLLWNYRGYCPVNGLRVTNSTRVDLGYELESSGLMQRVP